MSTTQTLDDAARAKRLAHDRRLKRIRVERRKSERREAVLSGEAVFISPTEFARLSGMSADSIYRRCAAGLLEHRKEGAGKRGGRIFIRRNQLP